MRKYLVKQIYLTAPEISTYTLNADFLRGLLPALMGAVLFLGNSPRMSLPVRAGAVPKAVSSPGHFCSGQAENLRRCFMKEHTKGQAEPESAVKDLVLSHLRCIELQARLLLLSSAFEIQFQSEDVRCLGVFLTTWADRVKKSLSKEVK
jgi:hypothetical protein